MNVTGYLRRLLRVKYLNEDAKADIAFMLRLHEEREFNLAHYSPAVLVYPFLVNKASKAGRVLRASLKGFTGDLFQSLADDE